jgi:prefoldin subunit 5
MSEEDPEIVDFDPNMDYEKYQAFVVETLEPRLKDLLGQREILMSELEGYASVPIFVANQQEIARQGGITAPIRKLVDIGCGVACQAEATPQGKICLSLGIDSFAELSYEEAIIAAREREDLLEKKCEKLDEEISNCVNDIEEVLGSLAQLQQLGAGTGGNSTAIAGSA